MSTSIAGGSLKVFNKSTKDLYRDCLRLIIHIAGRSRKSDNIRRVVRNEFRKNALIEDEDQIATLKAHAVRGLSNYLMIEAASKDKRLQEMSHKFNMKELDSVRSMKSTAASLNEKASESSSETSNETVK